MRVEAEDSFEIEIKIAGTYSEGYPGSLHEPPEDDRIEDPEILDLGVPVRREPRPGRAGGWDFKSLLEGVNKDSPDIRKLFENILQHRAGDVLDALFAEVED